MKIEIQVSGELINAADFASGNQDLSHGAHILFFGVVRRQNMGRLVTAVAYDAFPPLAESVLHEICQEAALKWGESLNFRLSHRTGELKVGEISLGISVSSKHRDEAYQASRFVIEELKIRAPIWKKEFYEDGESEWLKGHALCGHAETPPESSTTSLITHFGEEFGCSF